MTTTTCTAQVSDRGSFPRYYSCSNKAKPDTDPPRCGVHLPKAKGDPRPATAPATARVIEKVTVALSWPRGEGPRWVPRFSDRLVEATSLSITLKAGERPGDAYTNLSGAAFPVKKDGSLSENRTDVRFIDWDTLPAAIREAFLDALDKHEEQAR